MAYYSNGTVHEEGQYMADKKHGEWKTYNEQGGLDQSTVFRAGIALKQ